jgi:pimeloyl-ACP methyl ester carboxylesterase
MRAYGKKFTIHPRCFRLKSTCGIAKPRLAFFPRELQFPIEWAQRFVHVASFSILPRGGHFAALEEPALFAGAWRQFLSTC